jgi:hypothetical protein
LEKKTDRASCPCPVTASLFWLYQVVVADAGSALSGYSYPFFPWWGYLHLVSGLVPVSAAVPVAAAATAANAVLTVVATKKHSSDDEYLLPEVTMFWTTMVTFWLLTLLHLWWGCVVCGSVLQDDCDVSTPLLAFCMLAPLGDGDVGIQLLVKRLW